jgi:hypothetical protein
MHTPATGGHRAALLRVHSTHTTQPLGQGLTNSFLAPPFQLDVTMLHNTETATFGVPCNQPVSTTPQLPPSLVARPGSPPPARPRASVDVGTACAWSSVDVGTARAWRSRRLVMFWARRLPGNDGIWAGSRLLSSDQWRSGLMVTRPRCWLSNGSWSCQTLRCCGERPSPNGEQS